MKESHSTSRLNEVLQVHSLLVFLICMLAFLVRLSLFCGVGLGDDGNYFAAFQNIDQGMLYNTQYHWRVSHWLLHILSWRIFGVDEFTFVLPVLLASVGCVLMSSLVASLIGGKRAGLLVGLLMAFEPFEVLHATLIASDVILSFYMLSGTYFFLRGQQTSKKTYFFGAACLSLLAFLVKPFGLYQLPVFILLYFFDSQRKGRATCYLYFLACLFFLFGSLSIVSWLSVDDPFITIGIFYDKERPIKGPINVRRLLFYITPMFSPADFGQWLHGVHFYAVLIAALCTYFTRQGSRGLNLVLCWFLLLFCLVEFMPHQIIEGVPYTFRRLHRYFVPVIPPSVIFLGLWFDAFAGKCGVIKFHRTVCVYLLCSFLCCIESTRISRIVFGEGREAIDYLSQLGNVSIYTDPSIHWRIKLFKIAGSDSYRPDLHIYNKGRETDPYLQKFFAKITEGFVLTGGPGLPFYVGSPSSLLSLGPITPPSNWKLLREFDSTVYPIWKEEPLRVWCVGNSCENKLIQDNKS